MPDATPSRPRGDGGGRLRHVGGMRERAELVGGELEFMPAPGRGTTALRSAHRGRPGSRAARDLLARHAVDAEPQLLGQPVSPSPARLVLAASSGLCEASLRAAGRPGRSTRPRRESVADAVRRRNETASPPSARASTGSRGAGTRRDPRCGRTRPSAPSSISSWVRLTGIGWVTPSSSVSRVSARGCPCSL